jgi:lysophospholipase L1-like esterase
MLSASTAFADPITLTSVGDSLTASYAGHPYGAGHRGWGDLLGSLRPGSVHHFNYAQPGVTSGLLLSRHQHLLAAGVVHGFHTHPGALPGPMPFATLIVGANDVGAFVDDRLNGRSPDPDALVSGVVGNVYTVLATVQGAGTVGVVLATVPDIGKTPFFLQALQGQPALAQAITGLTQAINAQLLDLARARHVPVVDLYALNNLPSSGPLSIGGLNVNANMYGPDGFHPSTLGQGLLANAILEALHRGYGLDTAALRFSDNELLQAQGMLTGRDGYFDVSPHVRYHAAERSSLALPRACLPRRGEDAA